MRKHRTPEQWQALVDQQRASGLSAPQSCLPGEAGNPGHLKEGGVTPTEGKTIRLARGSHCCEAVLRSVFTWPTVGSEGSHRKLTVHNASEPALAVQVGQRAK